MTRLTLTDTAWRIAATVSACVLVLAGCTAGNEGQSRLVGDAGPISTESSPSTAVQMSGGYVIDARGRPVQPERSWPALTKDPLMDEETPEGVEAFARYFVAVAERAWNTGDTTELEAISSRECSLCSNLVSSIRDDYLAGRWVDGLEYDVLSTDEPARFPQDELKYVIFLRISTGSGVYSTGSAVKENSDTRETLELHTCRDSHHWVACGAIGNRDEL